MAKENKKQKVEEMANKIKENKVEKEVKNAEEWSKVGGIKKKEVEKAKGEIAKESSKKIEEKKIEKPSEIKKVTKKPKTQAVVNASGIPISTKNSVFVCKFIKGKTIPRAIRDLEDVISKKKAVPMKGEIPHRKGNMASGRFPKKVAQNFILLLKSLSSNASDIDNPIISEAIANFGSRPYGRFGRVKRKRTHIKIVAKNKNKLKEKKK